MMVRSILTITIFLSFYVPDAHGFDQAGLRPVAPNGVFSAFGASSLKRGETAFALWAERAEGPNFYRYSYQMAVGLTDRIELTVNIHYVDRWRKTRSGLEDMALGIKHRFFEEGRYGPSVAYLVSATLPTGKEDFTTEGSVGGGVIFSKRMGPVLGHVNLMYKRPKSSVLDDELAFFAALDFSASHHVRLLGELYGRSGHFVEDAELIELRVGYRYDSGDGLYTTLGVGTDLREGSPDYRILLSVTMLYPQVKQKVKRIYEEVR